MNEVVFANAIEVGRAVEQNNLSAFGFKIKSDGVERRIIVDEAEFNRILKEITPYKFPMNITLFQYFFLILQEKVNFLNKMNIPFLTDSCYFIIGMLYNSNTHFDEYINSPNNDSLFCCQDALGMALMCFDIVMNNCFDNDNQTEEERCMKNIATFIEYWQRIEHKMDRMENSIEEISQKFLRPLEHFPKTGRVLSLSKAAKLFHKEYYGEINNYYKSKGENPEFYYPHAINTKDDLTRNIRNAFINKAKKKNYKIQPVISPHNGRRLQGYDLAEYYEILTDDLKDRNLQKHFRDKQIFDKIIERIINKC